MRDINNLMTLKNRHEHLKAQIIAAIVLTKCGKTTGCGRNSELIIYKNNILLKVIDTN